MARSTNILLACMAMLGAMLLAVVMTPHNLMAHTHDVFDVDKHLPTKFGDWKPVEGLNVIAPPGGRIRSKPPFTIRRPRAASSTQRGMW